MTIEVRTEYNIQDYWGGMTDGVYIWIYMFKSQLVSISVSTPNLECLIWSLKTSPFN